MESNNLIQLYLFCLSWAWLTSTQPYATQPQQVEPYHQFHP
jgi:hypothetical protein